LNIIRASPRVKQQSCLLLGKTAVRHRDAGQCRPWPVNHSAAPPDTPQRTSQVNPSTPRQSTTATPPDRNFIKSLRGSAALLVSTTAITFPTAALLLRHVSLAATLLLGLVPVLPFLLASLVFLVGYTAAAFLAVLTTVIPGMRKDEDLSDRICWLLEVITNTCISFTTAAPLKLTRPHTKRGVQTRTSVPPATLPGVPSSPPKDADPVYWNLLQEMMASAHGGATPVPTIDEIFAGLIPGKHAMIPGKHAKPEVPPETTVKMPLPDVEPAVKVAA
jgi:hypothetical protein